MSSALTFGVNTKEMNSNHSKRSLQLPYAMASAYRAEAWPRLRKLAIEYKGYLEEGAFEDSGREEKRSIANHQIHTFLGLVEVADENISAAKQHLLDSISNFNSFALQERGPNLLLAKRLLEVGEKEVVLTFFEKVDAEWKGRLQRGNTAGWEKEISEGSIPDFGKNLDLYLPQKPIFPKLMTLARGIEFVQKHWPSDKIAS